MSYLILLGPPGSGKGTQAKRLVAELGVPSISTGDLIRHEVASSSEVGQRAKAYMDKGQLVPDDIIIELFKQAISKPEYTKGFISDGFPRNKEQAEAFDSLLTESGCGDPVILLFDVTLDVLLERILGRQICKSCNQIYHNTFNPSKESGVCDECGGMLITRSDDTEEVVRARYDVYKEAVAPLLEYYGGRVITLDAARSPEDVFNELMEHCKIRS